MAPVSGFDGLAAEILNALPHQRVVSLHATHPSYSWSLRLRRRLARACGRNAQPHTEHPPITPFVRPSYTESAAAVARLLESNPTMIGMLLAGEEQFTASLAEAPEEIRRRITIVLHQPPSWLRLHWRDFRSLDAMKAIVCLSTEQREFLTAVCSAPVIQIPHGVALTHFRPASDRQGGSPRLLLVGNWLRDYSTLRNAMHIVWAHAPSVQLDCVVPRHARDHEDLLHLARDQRVRWHAGISAEQLRDLYTVADLLFLPLIDATANNAVVEALACGLPIISSHVGGMPDYVTDMTGELCEPGNAAAHADAVLRWLADDNRRRSASAAARDFAEHTLNWNTITGALLHSLGVLGPEP